MASSGDTLSPPVAVSVHSSVAGDGTVHGRHHRSGSRSFSRRRSASAAGAVDVPMVPAVDLAALVVGATAPAEEDAAAGEQADAPPSPRAGTAEAAAAGGAGAVHMSTEYLQYLEALGDAWKDCPAVEVAFDQLTFAIRNEATIADAVQAARRARRGSGQGADLGIASGAAVKAPTAAEENTPNLAKAVVQMALAPVRLGQAAYRAATGVQPDPAEVLRALAPASGIIKPNSMTLVLAPPGQSQHKQLLCGSNWRAATR